MINVASLPNMQIIAEATVPETLAMPGVNGVTAKNANFSKILMATNSKTSAQTSLTGTLEQLLPQNDVGKTTMNQDMLDLLNGKTAGTISPNGIVDKKQLNTLLQTSANIAQKSLDIPATNAAVVQTEIKAPTGTAMIANAAKAAVNFVSGQNDSKVGIVSSNLQTVSVKTNKQTKGTNLLDVNQPVNMTVEDRSHVKSNTVIDAQLLDTAKPIVEKPVEIAKPIDAAIIDTVKPTEKNILNLSNTPLSAMKANPNEQHDVHSPTQFSQLMVNSLHSASGNAEPAIPVETTQQLAKYDIPGQIVEQARLIKTNEDTQMIIKLNPEHLGDLTLKVSIANGGAVTASFHSDNAQVRTMLESSMIQLKQELEAKGMKVDNVEVYAGLSDFMSNGQHNQANSQQQKSSLKNQRIDLADFADTVEKVNSSEGNISEDRVDYRI
jgi:flagellar hook-length control protein FliK